MNVFHLGWSSEVICYNFLMNVIGIILAFMDLLQYIICLEINWEI